MLVALLYATALENIETLGHILIFSKDFAYNELSYITRLNLKKEVNQYGKKYP
jgi:hypothetical protein